VPSSSLRKKVLVIDDDDEFGRQAALLLDSAGFVARFHRGPHGSLQAIRETACEVILLDVNMPALDGPRLVRMIRETFSAPRVNIILCSNMHESAVKRLALRLGADGAIQKPEDPHEIVGAFKTALSEAITKCRAAAASSATDPRQKNDTPRDPSISSTDLSSGLDINIEAPDLIVLKAWGTLAEHRGKAALDRVEAWAGDRPYFLLLFDLSALVALDAAAREHMSAWSSRVPPHAMATFGAGFHIQVVLEMVQRAASRLTGKALLRHFAPDEPTARAWLEKMRMGLCGGSY